MNGREIPGFYFDPELKKYFRIQRPQHGPRPESKYTLEKVRKEQKKQRVEKDKEAYLKRREKQTVIKRHARDSLTKASLDREVGHRGRSYYFQNVWPDACISGMRSKPRKIVDRPPDSSIRYFDRDPHSKTLYTVHGDNKIKRRRLNTPGGVPPPPLELDLESYAEHLPLNEYSFEPWDELAQLTSPISSLTYLPASGALAATTYGSDRPPVVYLSDPDRDGPYVNQQFTPKHTSSIWGAAARPLSFSSPSITSSNSIAATQVEHLVVAASSSLLSFTRSPSGTWDSKTVLSSDTDILALDWMSPTVIAFGSRDGRICLYDTRSNGSSHMFTHPNPVSQLRRADDPTRLVCAGLQDSLFLYDIRSSRLAGPITPFGTDHYYNMQYFENLYPSIHKSKRRKMSRAASRKYSQPILSFQHANPDDLKLGIDVHAGLGLVAAVEDQATSDAAIKIHNLWTGKMVKEIHQTSSGLGQAGSRTRYIKFLEDEENGGLSLWADWDGAIARFCW